MSKSDFITPYYRGYSSFFSKIPNPYKKDSLGFIYFKKGLSQAIKNNKEKTKAKKRKEVLLHLLKNYDLKSEDIKKINSVI